MDSIRLLRDELRKSLHGPAWHGPALLALLRDVPASEAVGRPLPAVHTIGEIALHCLAWTEEVTARLAGKEASLPERGDWPELPAALDEEAWSHLLDEIERAGTTLDERLARFPAGKLAEWVGTPEHDAPLGSGVSHESMLHGLAQHNAYHAGQVALLRRAGVSLSQVARGHPW